VFKQLIKKIENKHSTIRQKIPHRGNKIWSNVSKWTTLILFLWRPNILTWRPNL